MESGLGKAFLLQSLHSMKGLYKIFLSSLQSVGFANWSTTSDIKDLLWLKYKVVLQPRGHCQIFQKHTFHNRPMTKVLWPHCNPSRRVPYEAGMRDKPPHLMNKAFLRNYNIFTAGPSWRFMRVLRGFLASWAVKWGEDSRKVVGLGVCCRCYS